MAKSTRVQPTFDAPLMQLPPTRPPVPAASAPQPAPPAVAAVAAMPQRVFTADRPADDEAQPAAPQVVRVAELVAHRGTEGPLTIGIVGGPGAGKSRALSQLVAQATAFARGAGAAASPYVPGLFVVRLDAGDLGADPGTALAEQVHATLARGAPQIAAAAADEATHAAGDPHARLRAMAETLDGARRRLDGERRARDEAESRRARLIETILYESGGSRVDAYARANRTTIESTLASFGFTKDEPVATYKGLVQTLTESGGPAARVFASAKSLWAYRGQGKLLVWALILLIAAWSLGRFGHDMSWLDGAQTAGDTARSMADKVRAHGDWFALARLACLGGAALCLLACVVRAVRFSRPLLRGAELVDADLGVRRGELDNLVAHHTQRVDSLAGEADVLARRAQEAERRIDGAQAATPALLMPDAAVAAERSRRAYLDAVAVRLSQDAKQPGRLVVALDEVDRLPAAQALAVLEGTARALRHRSFCLVAAFDSGRLMRALGEDARERLDRLVQVPVRVDCETSRAWDALVAQIATQQAAAPAVPLDVTRSSLDRPIDATDQNILARLAPLAGPSPRGVKRFVNLYRLGRDDAGAHLPAFAFALALAVGGTPEEKAAFEATLRPGESVSAMVRDGAARLQAALEQVSVLSGRPMSVDDARRAKALAARWSLD